MTFADTLLPEFDHEMANTRKTLERIPESKFSWKPHDKSYTLGRLAVHIATLPIFGTVALSQDSLDLTRQFHPPSLKTRTQVVELFTANAGAARAAIACAGDETFGKPWSLMRGQSIIFTMPKIAVVRSLMMNHIIHHRAQLSVYLRMNNVPVPALYGPSADES